MLTMDGSFASHQWLGQKHDKNFAVCVCFFLSARHAMSQKKRSPESGQEFICSLSVVVKLSDYFISFSCFNFFAESIRVFS